MLEVYSAQWCTFCKQLKEYLELNNIQHTIIDIDVEIEKSKKLLELNLKTIPQVFKDGNHIGGFEDTVKYFQGVND